MNRIILILTIILFLISCGNKNNLRNIQQENDFELGQTSKEYFLSTRLNSKQENKECLLVAFS